MTHPTPCPLCPERWPVPAGSEAIESALRVLMRQAPCPHDNLDTRLGAGNVWAKCQDCGATIEQASIKRSRKAAREFEDAIAAVRAIASSVQAAPAQASAPGWFNQPATVATNSSVDAVPAQAGGVAVPAGWREVLSDARNRLDDDTPSAFDNSGYRAYARCVLDNVQDELEGLAATPAATPPAGAGMVLDESLAELDAQVKELVASPSKLLAPEYAEALREMATFYEMSEMNVLRAAIRLYQAQRFGSVKIEHLDRGLLQAAFTRALSLHPCRESAIAATAQALWLPAELVRECVE